MPGQRGSELQTKFQAKLQSKPQAPLQSRLLHEMREGAFRGAKRLPSENDLAKHLDVSRTQLRDTLARLEREGFISRRHGVGTVINRHVLALSVRMDLEVEFLEMVERSGYRPDVVLLSTERLPAEAGTAERLGLEAEEPVLRNVRLVTADGRPAIYCEDYIPLRLVQDPLPATKEMGLPIFHFLREHCGAEPCMDLTEIRAVPADGRAAEALGLAPGTPLLYMDEVDYDVAGRPILYARQFYVDGIVRHTLMRKKI